MGLAYVDSNTSDAGEILSESYPLLNTNNFNWSNLVFSAVGSRLAALQISFFSKCYLVLHMYICMHMYAVLIYLKLLGNRTSLSCLTRRTGTSPQKDLVSGLYYVFL